MKCKRILSGILFCFIGLISLTFYVILMMVSILTLKDSINHWAEYKKCHSSAAYMLLTASL